MTTEARRRLAEWLESVDMHPDPSIDDQFPVADLRALLESGSAAPPAQPAEGWVSVAERLPEPLEQVLFTWTPVNTPREYMVGCRAQHDGNLWLGSRPILGRLVTHWMPLPAAPDSAQDGEER